MAVAICSSDNCLLSRVGEHNHHQTLLSKAESTLRPSTLCRALLVPTLRQSQTTGFPSLLMNLECRVFILTFHCVSLVHRHISFVGGKGKGMVLPFSCSLFRLVSTTAECVKQVKGSVRSNAGQTLYFLSHGSLLRVGEDTDPSKNMKIQIFVPRTYFHKCRFLQRPGKSHSRHQIRTPSSTHTQNRVMSFNTDN